jgi:hypothetical protein
MRAGRIKLDCHIITEPDACRAIKMEPEVQRPLRTIERQRITWRGSRGGEGMAAKERRERKEQKVDGVHEGFGVTALATGTLGWLFHFSAANRECLPPGLAA